MKLPMKPRKVEAEKSRAENDAGVACDDRLQTEEPRARAILAGSRSKAVSREGLIFKVQTKRAGRQCLAEGQTSGGGGACTTCCIAARFGRTRASRRGPSGNAS
eukprot:174620-Amphidinium_carterae.1